MTLQERIAEPSAMLTRVDAVASSQLMPIVREIDDGHYPEDIMRAFGAAGAYGSHVAAEMDMGQTIQAIARGGEECISTAFCMWCQSALAWYIGLIRKHVPQDNSLAQGRRRNGTWGHGPF